MGQSLRQVTQDRMISRMNNLSNLYSGDTYSNRNVKKRNRFYEQNNDSALASRFFCTFLCRPCAQLRRLEMIESLVDLRTGNAR